MRSVVLALALTAGAMAGERSPSRTLPEAAVRQLGASLEAARGHDRHVWRDVPPLNPDGTVNAYIEIPRGDRVKWEFDMTMNRRAIDRVIARDLGGYPVNYGFVPQTVSYDGDPFDVLVLGPPIAGGALVRGTIVGLMDMDDEKGRDAKVVISPLLDDGRAEFALTNSDRDTIGRFFHSYKRAEPGRFSRVTGWGSARDGQRHVEVTHQFYRLCRQPRASRCVVEVESGSR